MLLTDTGYQLVEHLERQRDAPALLASFQRLVLAFGMDSFCIGDPSHPDMKREDRRWGASFPVGWYRRYIGQNHITHDPVVARMNETSAPFRWAELREHARPRSLRVLDEAAQFGLRDGYAVPIHRSDGSVIGVSIATASYDLSQRDTLALQMASYYLHARLASLRAQRPVRPGPSLTPRERECLKWVAAGKTDWEISQILNISEQTAHGYVQNALIKLGARTRAQAVAQALLSSQLLH